MTLALRASSYFIQRTLTQMLRLNQLIGFGAGGIAAPASFTFNGTDEALTRTLVTSAPSTTIFTYSLWVKVAAYASGHAPFYQVINAPTNTAFIACGIQSSGDVINLGQDDGANDWQESVTGITPDIPTATWQHIVFQYDSTQGTADNRIRMYRNSNSVLTDTAGGSGAPGASEAHGLFTNGRQHQIGGYLDVPRRLNGKLAFIDVLDGVSADASAFAFDNGGTWTRMPYAGSYGTHGFSLDGTDGFNDVSGNGQHFTGVNMDATNLDFADLPPFI